MLEGQGNTPIMWLPLEQVPPTTARETRAELGRVASLAVSGSSGLVRRLSGERPTENVRALLINGSEFLQVVMRDIDRVKYGVNLSSPDAKVNYHPDMVFRLHSWFSQRRPGSVEEEELEKIRRYTRIVAVDLLSVFNFLAKKGQPMLDRGYFVGKVHDYTQLSDPYVTAFLQS